MQMRHEPRLLGYRVEQVVIRLDTIDRGQPQPGEIWRCAQYRFHQPAEPRSAVDVAAVGGEIDAGQDDLVKTLRDAIPRGGDDLVRGRRARRAATVGDDAEGAAMVAAGLNGKKRAGVI